jgi:hypothetical protein
MAEYEEARRGVALINGIHGTRDLLISRIIDERLFEQKRHQAEARAKGK